MLPCDCNNYCLSLFLLIEYEIGYFFAKLGFTKSRFLCFYLCDPFDYFGVCVWRLAAKLHLLAIYLKLICELQVEKTVIYALEILDIRR